jgi:hypothetical protein
MWITGRGVAILKGTNFSVSGMEDGRTRENRNKEDLIEMKNLLMRERKLKKLFHVRLAEVV